MPRYKKRANLSKESSQKSILRNLRKIRKNIHAIEDNKLPTFQIVAPEKHQVETIVVSKNELEELAHEIDAVTQKASTIKMFPLPAKLGSLAKQLADSDKSTIAIAAKRLKSLLHDYQQQIDEYYVNPNIWKTPDTPYQDLIGHPQKFSPKAGGAKNAGKRTGVYHFKNKSNHSATMLIKQGADVGETVAEYVGANLYALTIPEYSARCIMVKDQSTDTDKIEDVYVASIFEKAEQVQDAFAAAGYSSRGMFAGEKARIKHLFNKDDSLIRKILEINDNTGHTLEYSAANVLWHGDHDFHTGNVVYVKNSQGSKFVKIDHGFSFFNFKRKLVDIFNPMAGKVFSISPKKFAKGGKLIEFYPTNHFWDFAIENKQFYFNASFVKACEEIANQNPESIRNNIKQSLTNIQNIYGENANEALKQFALRIGMKKHLITPLSKGNPDLLRYKIENHMVLRLMQRQASMAKLAKHCQKNTAKLDKKRYTFSKKLNKTIIKKLDIVSKEASKEEASLLLKEVALLKLIQQANDLGIFSITNTGEFIIESDFYYHHNGQREIVTPADFKERMQKILSKSTISKTLESSEDSTLLSEDSLSILHEMRLALRNTSSPTKTPNSTSPLINSPTRQHSLSKQTVDMRKQSIMKFLNEVTNKLNAPFTSSEGKLETANQVNAYRTHYDPEISQMAESTWKSVVNLTVDLTLPKKDQTFNFIDVNISKMYEEQRNSNSVGKSDSLRSFARNAVKSVALGKDPKRAKQIADLQKLIDKAKAAKNVSEKDNCTQELYFALEYIKHEIKSNEHALSLESTLSKVCDDVIAKIPPEKINEFKKIAHGSDKINQIGKDALDNASTKRANSVIPKKPYNG